MPYPQAMRERAIAAHLEQGIKKTEICKIFNIQRCTLDQWPGIYEKEGRTLAKEKYQKGHSHHVQDIEAFRQFLEETPFNTIHSSPLNNVSGAKSATGRCAVGCTVPD